MSGLSVTRCRTDEKTAVRTRLSRVFFFFFLSLSPSFPFLLLPHSFYYYTLVCVGYTRAGCLYKEAKGRILFSVLVRAVCKQSYSLFCVCDESLHCDHLVNVKFQLGQLSTPKSTPSCCYFAQFKFLSLDVSFSFIYENPKVNFRNSRVFLTTF